MTKLSVATVLSLILALPVSAQALRIEDDGIITLPEAPPAAGPIIEINDDGISELAPDAEAEGTTGAIVGAPGQCTAVESSAGMSGAECGSLSAEQVIQRLDG